MPENVSVRLQRQNRAWSDKTLLNNEDVMILRPGE